MCGNHMNVLPGGDSLHRSLAGSQSKFGPSHLSAVAKFPRLRAAQIGSRSGPILPTPGEGDRSPKQDEQSNIICPIVHSVHLVHLVRVNRKIKYKSLLFSGTFSSLSLYNRHQSTYH